MNFKTKCTVVSCMLLSLSGCSTLNAPFTMPKFELPELFRGTQASPTPSFAETDWKHIYTDAALQPLIAEALTAGPDALLAAARLRESQALATAVRSLALPQVGFALNTSPTALQTDQSLSSTFIGGLSVSWELDLWGRYASATEAARADIRSREASRHAIQASLVANTASLYYQIVALRSILTVTQRAYDNQREVLQLVNKLSAAGVASAAEERQQENVVAGTLARAAGLKRQIVEAENALSILVGRVPGAVQIDVPADLALPELVPAGLPSSLLERRPDIQQAVAQMQSAHAKVNEARALFFPSISLSSLLGGVSTGLGTLLSGKGTQIASLGPNVLFPLFTGGALEGNEAANLARLDQSVIGYRKTVLAALGEVADSLNAYSITAEVMAIQDQRVTASREVQRLAWMRFNAGTTSFLEVLDAQRQLLNAETDQVQSLLDRRLSWIRLYLTLGGGWQANS